jgi:hypothetical protein
MRATPWTANHEQQPIMKILYLQRRYYDYDAVISEKMLQLRAYS